MPQYISTYTPAYRAKKKTSLPHIDMILIDTPKKFKKMVSLWKDSPRVVGFDTETTGLNHTKVDLVGCSIAFNRAYSFYLPFGHMVVDGSPNLPLEYFGLTQELLNRSKCVLYWNKKFDKRIRRAFGHTDIPEDQECDLQIVYYNWDTNVGSPALKSTLEEALGWQLPSYEEKFGKNADLSMYRPKEVLEYAGYDAVSLLYLLDDVNNRFLDRDKFLLHMDEVVTNVISDIEETPMPINKEVLKELQVEYKGEMKSLQEKIDGIAKQKLNPESPKQVQSYFISNKIDTGEKTKKGSMACGEKQLERIKKSHPIIPMILEHRKMRKLMGTYLKPLVDSPEVHFAYKTCQASTGRLSGGTDKKNDFFTHVNIQGIPKANSMDYLACYKDSDSYRILELSGQFDACFKKNVEGWYFFPVRKDIKDDGVDYWVGEFLVGRDLEGCITEGFDPKGNVRRAFECREGDYYVHLDFSAQELRLPANFSHDKALVEVFLSGLDPHRQTAIMLFGEENYNGDMRKIAKILNFNLLYGGQKYSIGEKLHTTPDKAQEYIDGWWNLYRGVQMWRNKLILQGKKTGVIKTAFNRIRRVSFWLNSQDYSVRSFGERTCINTTVQGTGGDIIRLALIRAAKLGLHKSLECLILSVVHDEINYSVKKEKLYEIIPQILKAMNVKRKNWKVPMDLGLAVGFSWGEMWDFDFVDGKLVPSGEYIKKG